MIVLDIGLASSSGFTVLLHAARLRPCSGILVITGDADITSENLPVDGAVLLHKPFGPTSFMEQVRIIAKRHAALEYTEGRRS